MRCIRSSRACTSTCTATSSGIRLRSISSRQKSKSVCEAEGNPTSISLNPQATSRSNKRSLRAVSIGSTSAWFPSRRSTLHHAGALSIVFEGQLLSWSRKSATGRYFVLGSFSISSSPTPQKVKGRQRFSPLTASQSSSLEQPQPGTIIRPSSGRLRASLSEPVIAFGLLSSSFVRRIDIKDVYRLNISLTAAIRQGEPAAPVAVCSKTSTPICCTHYTGVVLSAGQEKP